MKNSKKENKYLQILQIKIFKMIKKKSYYDVMERQKKTKDVLENSIISKTDYVISTKNNIKNDF